MEVVSVGLAVTAVLGVVTAALLYLYSSYDYFHKRNIPYARLRSPMGSGNLTQAYPHFLWDMYRQCGDRPLLGYFVLWAPAVLIKDLDLVRHVLVKSYTSFYDRPFFHDEKNDPLGGNLFALEGETWKKVRAKLSPAFTNARTKLMFPTIVKNAERLVSYIAEQPSELESCDVMAKYALSNIANTAFGLDTDSFTENKTFLNMARSIVAPSLRVNMKAFLLVQLREWCSTLGVTFMPRDTARFFLKVIREAVAYREANNVHREDTLQMLMQLKNKGYIDESSGDNVPLTIEQVTAHSVVFILGGFETSALTMSWALYELALNPEVQRRLQAEMDAVQDWSYDHVMALPYLDMVVCETLRKYPSVPFLIRKSTEDFRVPGSDLVIEKGTDVSISLFGLHRDPKLFPDPDKFIPERFGPNPPHEIRPYSYMPFSEGHRNCIASRFGKMQVKHGLAVVMRHFRVEPTPRTDIPARFHPLSVQTVSRSGVWLRFTKRVE